MTNRPRTIWLPALFGVALGTGLYPAAAQANPFPVYPQVGQQVIYDVILRASANRKEKRGARVATTTVLCQRGHMLLTGTAIRDGARRIDSRTVSYRLLVPLRLRQRIDKPRRRISLRYLFDRTKVDAFVKAAGASAASLMVRWEKDGTSDAGGSAARVTLHPVRKEQIKVPAGTFQTFRLSTEWLGKPGRSGQPSSVRRAMVWLQAETGAVVRLEHRLELNVNNNRYNVHHIYLAAEIRQVTPPAGACTGMPTLK